MKTRKNKNLSAKEIKNSTANHEQFEFKFESDSIPMTTPINQSEQPVLFITDKIHRHWVKRIFIIVFGLLFGVIQPIHSNEVVSSEELQVISVSTVSENIKSVVAQKISPIKNASIKIASKVKILSVKMTKYATKKIVFSVGMPILIGTINLCPYYEKFEAKKAIVVKVAVNLIKDIIEHNSASYEKNK